MKKKFKIGDVAKTVKEQIDVKIIDIVKEDEEIYYVCLPLNFKSFERYIKEEYLTK